jgi:methylmalonyl-CoA mutase cobalamin-binding domain/chain
MTSSPDLLAQIERAVLLGSVDEVPRLCRQAVETNVPVENVLGAMRQGAQQTGEKYENGEYFVPDLLLTAAAMKEGFKVLEPLLDAEEAGAAGTVVIGTVFGDVHDIGKDIVAGMLRSAGFNVVDLGINVPSETFAEEAKRLGADVIAASAYTSTTMRELRTVIECAEDAGIRDQVLIVVGGAPTNQAFATGIGADGWAVDGPSAVGMVERLLAARKGQEGGR